MLRAYPSILYLDGNHWAVSKSPTMATAKREQGREEGREGGREERREVAPGSYGNESQNMYESHFCCLNPKKVGLGSMLTGERRGEGT